MRGAAFHLMCLILLLVGWSVWTQSQDSQSEEAKALSGPRTDIQYKARRWVDGTNSWEIWYYNGLKKLGMRRMVVRFRVHWYENGDTDNVQQVRDIVVYLEEEEAFWLMNQIANHFEGISKLVEENYCPECLPRGRRLEPSNE